MNTESIWLSTNRTDYFRLHSTVESQSYTRCLVVVFERAHTSCILWRVTILSAACLRHLTWWRHASTTRPYSDIFASNQFANILLDGPAVCCPTRTQVLKYTLKDHPLPCWYCDVSLVECHASSATHIADPVLILMNTSLCHRTSTLSSKYIHVHGTFSSCDCRVGAERVPRGCRAGAAGFPVTNLRCCLGERVIYCFHTILVAAMLPILIWRQYITWSL